MAECPKCGNEIGRSAYCGCGWKRFAKDKPDARAEAFPLGYQQCEWTHATDRCRYPGTLSTNTGQGGPYYCRLHFACIDPIFGAQVVDASFDYVHETVQERVDKATAEARANLERMGLGRMAGESERDYIDRLRGECRTMFAGIAKRIAA